MNKALDPWTAIDDIPMDDIGQDLKSFVEELWGISEYARESLEQSREDFYAGKIPPTVAVHVRNKYRLNVESFEVIGTRVKLTFAGHDGATTVELETHSDKYFTY